jgi:hypothetical protein
MENRFENASDEVKELVENVIDNSFRELRNAKILVLFDCKKRISKGKMVMGRMQKTNDLLRHLTLDNTMDEDGYDYILYLDKMIITNIQEEDQIRIIRHELQHAEVDYDSNKPYKLRDHEISDFYDEIEFNSDDARWGVRIASIGHDMYEQEADRD